MLNLQLRNLHLHKWDGVALARLYVDPAGPVAPPVSNEKDKYTTADNNGGARIDVSGLSPGEHTLWVIPKFTSADPVGLETATGVVTERIYRSLRIQFSVVSTKTVGSAVVHSSTMANGTIVPSLGSGKDQSLEVRLRPIWIKSPFNYKRTKPIDMIVVHKTGGPEIGPAINQFLSGGTSAHYIIDRDGEIVKCVLEDRVAAHASNENNSDKSFWGTQRELAWRSIGIENVGSTKQGLEAAQYRSLIGLIQQIMTCYSVPRYRVIGHSDILTDGQGVLSDQRIACPGFQFEWSQLENAKGQTIGLARTGGASGNDPVAAFFTAAAANKASRGKPVVLIENDFDPAKAGTKVHPGKFGGQDYPDVTDTPITLLQTWLSEIGYSVGPATGKYNNRFFRAVLHFQTHFLGQGATGRIDQQTATLIRAVRQANPKAD